MAGQPSSEDTIADAYYMPSVSLMTWTGYINSPWDNAILAIRSHKWGYPSFAALCSCMSIGMCLFPHITSYLFSSYIQGLKTFYLQFALQLCFMIMLMSIATCSSSYTQLPMEQAQLCVFSNNLLQQLEYYTYIHVSIVMPFTKFIITFILTYPSSSVLKFL